MNLGGIHFANRLAVVFLAVSLSLSSIPAYAQELDNLSPLEIQLTGQKFDHDPSDTRINRLETMMNQPTPAGASKDYRVSELYTAQQNMMTMKASTTAVAAYNHGVDAANAGDIPGAVAAYEEAVRLSPTFVQAYNNLANLYEKQHEYEKAVDAYAKILPLSQSDPLLHRNYGIVLEKAGKIKEALTQYRAYLNLAARPDPAIVELVNSFDAYHDRGTVLTDYVDNAKEGMTGELRLWPSDLNPIPFYVFVSSTDQTMFLPVIYEAFNTWEKASKGRLRFVETTDSRLARIRIQLADGPLSHPFIQVGHAEYNVTQDPNQQDLTVRVTVNIGESGSTLSLKNRQEQVKRLALHELGHAIGIWGHSPDPEDIMYAHPIVSNLSHRDEVTIQKLYKLAN